VESGFPSGNATNAKMLERFLFSVHVNRSMSGALVYRFLAKSVRGGFTLHCDRAGGDRNQH
jgi:hypothetical protein